MSNSQGVPNPGSDAAIDSGCLCPVLDNNHGRGCCRYHDYPEFWINWECPLHGGESGWVSPYRQETEKVAENGK